MSQFILAQGGFSYQRGEEPSITRELSVLVHSIHDVPISLTPPNGEARFQPVILAALVDENHPEIERLVSDALQVGVVTGFQGYKGDEQSVFNSVFAIWLALQKRLFRLIDSINPSAESKYIRAVRVRSFSEIFASRTGSSVEFALILAASLRRAGYDSALLANKATIAVGYRLKTGGQWSALDPTQLGMTDLSKFADSRRDNDPSRGLNGASARQEVVLLGKLLGALVSSQKDTKFSAAESSFNAGVSSAREMAQAGDLKIAMDLSDLRKKGILGGNW